VTWARVFPTIVTVACVLVILANAPAVLVDPLYKAIAQIRVNAATTVETKVTSGSSESSPTSQETLVKKAE
jgi:uncharacterized protein involved in exopolysaccharide biosynthesis